MSNLEDVTILTTAGQRIARGRPIGGGAYVTEAYTAGGLSRWTVTVKGYNALGLTFTDEGHAAAAAELMTLGLDWMAELGAGHKHRRDVVRAACLGRVENDFFANSCSEGAI